MTKFVITATWDDVPHLTGEQKWELWQSIPPYQRDARSKGIPQLGSGAIYPVPESEIVCEPFDIPPWWPRSYGMDVGWNMTVAVWGARDPETDVLYIYSEYARGQAEPPSHAAAIRSRGDWMLGVIDPGSRGRSQADGLQLMVTYGGLGLTLTLGKNAVEAGLFECLQRMSTGRLRVFTTCRAWFSEFRLYRRDEKGNVVKKNDHLMDATRYLVMSGINVGTTAPDVLARASGSLVTSEYEPW